MIQINIKTTIKRANKYKRKSFFNRFMVASFSFCMLVLPLVGFTQVCPECVDAEQLRGQQSQVITQENCSNTNEAIHNLQNNDIEFDSQNTIVEAETIKHDIPVDKYISNDNEMLIEMSMNSKKEIDFGSFDASYNLLAATAQLELGNEEDIYRKWYDKQEGDLSATFIAWCSQKIRYDDIVPIVHSANELKKFYETNGNYYKQGACYPCTGDLVLFDLNKDLIPDHVEIITMRIDSYFRTVGLKAANDGTKMIVCESKYNVYNKSVYGFCRPNYNMTKSNFAQVNRLQFNAVDTVVAATKQEYADALANHGVEVIARYINPEGRTPLSIEEAQMYFNAGIRVMMIYEAEAKDPYRGYKKGVEIGTKALEYARALRAPKGTPIFYCCDSASMFDSFSDVAEFICGVKDVMQGEYTVGLYGGFHVVEAMYNIGLIDAYWQTWSMSGGYVSDNYDVIQYLYDSRLFNEIPYAFDANYVKDPAKVSYMLPKINKTNSKEN